MNGIAEEDDPTLDPELQTFDEVRSRLMVGLTAPDLAALFKVDPKTAEIAVGAISPVDQSIRKREASSGQGRALLTT